MPDFDIDKEEVNAFKIEVTYLFKEHFWQNDIFDQLEEYYNRDKYRFEVPGRDIKEVRQILDEYHYELNIVDNLGEYCVVADKEADTEEILRNAVMKTRKNGVNVYLMKDELSVKQAVESGASRLPKIELEEGSPRWEIDRP